VLRWSATNAVSGFSEAQRLLSQLLDLGGHRAGLLRDVVERLDHADLRHLRSRLVQLVEPGHDALERRSDLIDQLDDDTGR
jgi:hypothetical protein